MSRTNSKIKYQELIKEQKEIKSRLRKIESLLCRLASRELFESLSGEENLLEKKVLLKIKF